MNEIPNSNSSNHLKSNITNRNKSMNNMQPIASVQQNDYIHLIK